MRSFCLIPGRMAFWILEIEALVPWIQLGSQLKSNAWRRVSREGCLTHSKFCDDASIMIVIQACQKCLVDLQDALVVKGHQDVTFLLKMRQSDTLCVGFIRVFHPGRSLNDFDGNILPRDVADGLKDL